MHTLAVSPSPDRSTVSRWISSATREQVLTAQATTFVDITDALERFVSGSGVRTGTVTVQTLHTTTALIVNEAEPLLLVDFASLLDRLAPRSSLYHHDDLARRVGVAADEPRNGHAHCRSLLLPTSVTLTVIGARLLLGRWQRLFLVDLDGPRRREWAAVVSGEAAR